MSKIKRLNYLDLFDVLVENTKIEWFISKSKRLNYLDIIDVLVEDSYKNQILEITRGKYGECASFKKQINLRYHYWNLWVYF